MDRVRTDLAGRPAGTRSVVLAHAFVAGGAPSDSERDITVGGVAAVPTGIFDGVDYVALGHLHGSQVLTPRVRYSGSPLAYSFSEAGHRKTMWLIDLGEDGSITGDVRLDCPVPRPLARVRGRLDDLLADPALAPHEQSWVEATLTDPVRPAEPMARLTERFPHTLNLVFDPERTGYDHGASYAQRLRDRSDQQIAEDFVAHVRGGAALDGDERASPPRRLRRRPRRHGRARGGPVRLHRLEITAFGPFGTTQKVDFDALSAAGLFLLHGPTGAGKTLRPRRRLLRPVRERARRPPRPPAPPCAATTRPSARTPRSSSN
ncbi:hypothetical protein STANM309S_03577 [Streptomyces tanashiensis]